jgi:Leucine-rich repeat (LRR) protein
MAGEEQDHRDRGPPLPYHAMFAPTPRLMQAQNISSLSSLRILSLQSNRISTISSLSSLSSLEELYISHNALASISGLEGSHALRVLDISNNKIEHLTGLAHLANLEEVWASHNLLASFEEVDRELRDKKNLNTVYFEGNPLQTKNPVLYRNKVRLALPQVKQIDASESHMDQPTSEIF